MNPSRPIALLSVPLLLLVAGCGDDLEEAVVEAVVSSALETSRTGQSGRFVTEVRLPADASCVSDPAYAAADAAARPAVGLYPAGCLAKEAQGVKLHGQFSGCTGAFGRVELHGGIDALFSPGDDCSVHAEVTDSGDLTANGRPLDYQASATIRFAEGTRDVDWNAHWRGTTKRDRPIEQRSSLRVVSDDESGCVRIDGAAEGTVASWSFDKSVEGLTICPEACPSAGVIDATLHSERRDRSIRVEFDGSRTAKAIGWSGREMEIEMVCEGE